MAVIDIIVIAGLLVFGIIGMVKGFLNTILSLFSTVASIGVAIFCAKPVSKFLNNTFGLVSKIGGKIAESIGAGITPFQSAEAAGSPITGEYTGEMLKNYLGNDGLTFQERIYRLFIEDSKVFTAGETAAQSDQIVVQYIGERLAAVISVIIAAVLIFIAIKIAVLLLSKLFNALTKHRAISGIDRTLGLLFGLVKASVIICVVLGVFYLIANSTVQGWIDNSVVTKWIYQYVTQFVDFIASKYDLPSFITGLFPTLTPSA